MHMCIMGTTACQAQSYMTWDIKALSSLSLS